jgi:hypothetical protein
MTDAQRKLLHEMMLRPHGIVVRDPDSKAVLDEITFTGWVSDVYEMPDGSRTARITASGRDALKTAIPT